MIVQVLIPKFLGALIGTGVGDTLGELFEGQRKVKLGEIEEIAETRRVLTYTDDTHTILGVVKSLIQTRGFDGEHMTQTVNRQRKWHSLGSKINGQRLSMSSSRLER